jgi:hypothetical protein
MNEDLEDVKEKIYTRDLFLRDWFSQFGTSLKLSIFGVWFFLC